MTGPSQIFDPGLQPERTLLAWRRTCLSFAIASLIGARFTVDHLGLVAVIVGMLGSGLAAAAYFATVIGYRRAQHSLHSRSTSGTTGTPIVLATVAALIVGVACAGFIALDVPALSLG